MSMTYQAVNLRFCVFAFFISVFLAEPVKAQEMGYIFCPKCTHLANNIRRTVAIDRVVIEQPTREQEELLRTILDFELSLNTQYPEKSKIAPNIIGHGSTSLGFLIPNWEHLLIRRLPGFSNYQAAMQHIYLINQYRSKLHDLMIQTTSTQLIALEDAHGYGVVYVIQPYLTDNQLSKTMFRKFGTKFKRALLRKQAEIARDVISYNIDHPESAITIDIVNNNWEISNFNPMTMDFDVRLNDLAQPLFKENFEVTYDFHDQAFSILYPLDYLVVQNVMKEEFSELFHPKNLMMQALWGYDEPAHFFYRLYLWITGAPSLRAYPQWAMDTVNEVLSFFHYNTITSREALQAHQQDKSAIACMRLYRELTRRIRSTFRLNSNVYMNPGETDAEMYANDKPPGYIECFRNVLN